MSSGSQIVSGIPVQRTVRALQSLPTSFFSPQHQLPLCQGIQKVNGSQKPVRLLLSHISLSRTFYSTRRIAAAPTQALPATLLSIALTDESPAWTLDQIAGLVFGGIMLASVLLATKVDLYIARAQRRDLGLCEDCGGLNDANLCKAGKCPDRK